MKKDEIPEELRSLCRYQKLWVVDSILWLIITPLLYFDQGSSAALVSFATAVACWLSIGFLEARKKVHKHFNYGEKGINFFVRTTYFDYWPLYCTLSLAVVGLVVWAITSFWNS